MQTTITFFPRRAWAVARVAALLAVAVGCLNAALAQQPDEVARAAHFSLDPRALYRAASSVAVPDGAIAAVLEEDERYSFDAQGRMTHTGHYIYKILTEKGAEAWDAISVDWAPWHEARPVIRARVITPDFAVHTLDAGSITELPARDGDYKIYSDGKILHAPLPAIAPGVVVEEEFVETETEPLFAAGRAVRVQLGNEQVPVGASRVVIEAPESMPLRTATVHMEGIEAVRSVQHGRVSLVYDKGRTEGIDPAEPLLPHDVTRYPEVRFSTAKSWQALASEYARIVEAHMDTAAVRSVVARATAGKATAADKERALVDVMDREVRSTETRLSDKYCAFT